jgi:hypothetical protein
MAARKRGKAGTFDEGFFSAPFPRLPHALMLVDGRVPAVWLFGACRQEVVGESSYVEALQVAVWACDARGNSFTVPDGTATVAYATAWLTPEPSNQFDMNALAVYIESRKCGYLPKLAAAHWSPHVQDLQAAYGRHVACGAVIFGNRSAGLLGVWLMLERTFL